MHGVNTGIALHIPRIYYAAMDAPPAAHRPVSGSADSRMATSIQIDAKNAALVPLHQADESGSRSKIPQAHLQQYNQTTYCRFRAERVKT